MSISQAVFGFALVAGLLTLVPGLDTTLVLRSALTRTRTVAVMTALGITAGSLTWGIAAALGASALLAASEVAYRALTLAGAAYMIWMGVSLIIASLRRRGAGTPEPDAVPAPQGGSLWRAWSMGFVTNLLNPKVGVFYIATIPQFTPAGVPPILMGVILAGVHCVLGMIWFAGIIGASGVASRWLRGQRAARIIDRVTGTVLIGFGVKLAVAPR